MKVRFVVDYRGVLTGEQWFQAGQEAEIADLQAEQLIADGRAEAVKPAPKPEPKQEPEPPKRSTRKS